MFDSEEDARLKSLWASQKNENNISIKVGTTTTGVMKDFIKEDIQNFNMSTIYYSTNEKATKSIEKD